MEHPFNSLTCGLGKNLAVDSLLSGTIKATPNAEALNKPGLKP